MAAAPTEEAGDADIKAPGPVIRVVNTDVTIKYLLTRPEFSLALMFKHLVSSGQKPSDAVDGPDAGAQTLSRAEGPPGWRSKL